MLSNRRRPCRGAGTLLVSLVTSLVLAGSASAGALFTLVATDARAQAAADAAAHAAASVLAVAPDRESLVESVAAAPCIWAEGRPDAAAGDGCLPALRAGRSVLTSVPGARLIGFSVSADPRSSAAMAAGSGRVGLQAWAEVAVDRRLPVMGRLCMDSPDQTSAWCYAIASAGAQETSPWG